MLISVPGYGWIKISKIIDPDEDHSEDHWEPGPIGNDPEDVEE